MASKSKNIFQDPIKLVYMTVPVVLMLGIGTFTMGIDDTMQVLKWLLVLLIFGLASLPLSAWLFKGSGSAGFFLSQPLGLLTVSLVVWELSYINIFKFNRVFIIITLLLMAGVCYGLPVLRRNLVDSLSKEYVIERITLEESVFSVALVLLCYFKGFLPDINGQEKFMDYGFIMSMLRGTRLPANDIWLSGYTINYYYFGQYIYALLIKLSGIKSSIGYNIAMCSAIAVPFGMCYSIGCMLVETARDYGMRCSRIIRTLCGLLCAFTTIIFGNSHSFFYDETSFGNKFLALFSKMGINVGKTTDFFYPESTRYIGYNPDSKMLPWIKNGGDYTIEEFPFYSYLVGDLHAHVASSMVVLLILALCVAYIRSLSGKTYEFANNSRTQGLVNFSTSKNGFLFSELKMLLDPRLVAAAITLGIAQMTNYWDFLIYFIFLSMTILVIHARTSEVFTDIYGAIIFVCSLAAILGSYLVAGDRPWLLIFLMLLVTLVTFAADVFSPSALTRVSFGMSFIFLTAHIIALPFNVGFDMISNSLGKCVNHSSLFQLFILYGTHVITALIFVVFVIIFKNWRFNTGDGKKKKRDTLIGQRGDTYPNGIARFLGERNLTDIFVVGMIAVAILLIIAPEIFYVRDIYTGGYLRSNTMFKFTYAAMIILSMAISYGVIRMCWMVTRKGQYSAVAFILSIILTLNIILIPGHYTVISLNQRCNGSFSREQYKTLDGAAYLATYTSHETGLMESGNLMNYYNCIEWFNSEVKGTPVILETYGESYKDYDIVSAYTGLQTVIGWETHEWLWRYKGIVNPVTDLLEPDPEANVWDLYLDPRHEDVWRVYTSDDPGEIYDILNKYSVEYVIIGSMEKARFNHDNTEVIETLGTRVFESGDLVVIKIDLPS